MSRQLSLSATFSILAMAAFVLVATPDGQRPHELGATTAIAAPAFKAKLPGS